jgi:hypothetical protein
MESAFSSITDTLEPPLIVDSGASCCISPARVILNLTLPAPPKSRICLGPTPSLAKGC